MMSCKNKLRLIEMLSQPNRETKQQHFCLPKRMIQKLRHNIKLRSRCFHPQCSKSVNSSKAEGKITKSEQPLHDPQRSLNCIHNEEWILISVVEYEVGTVATPRPAPILITGWQDWLLTVISIFPAHQSAWAGVTWHPGLDCHCHCRVATCPLQTTLTAPLVLQ